VFYQCIEYIQYTGKTLTTFTGLTRAIVNLTGPGSLTGGGGNGTAQTFTYSASAPTAVSVYSPQASGTISHWGSAVIMDGRYDDDKSLVFVAGMQQPLTSLPIGATAPVISIRIAPSVDSGITGLVGQREILNRMQLIMRSMATLVNVTASSLLCTIRLNSYGLNQGTLPAFSPAGGSSLAQVCYHMTTTPWNAVTGGEVIYAFLPNGGVGGVTFEDLSQVRDIGNSILGGGNSLQFPISQLNKYPDGPDIITICLTNVGTAATGQINARISWTEAQA